MTQKYLAFDIEIAKSLPNGVDNLKAYRPLGITCAATYFGEDEPRLWYKKISDDTVAPQMDAEQLIEMLTYLEERVEAGYTLLTWNGCGFDFDILAEESRQYLRCRTLAWNHVDMMFHFFCKTGYGLGLDKAAKGMGLPGKPIGMSGELAPRYWAEGKWAIVLDYVSQDVRTTLNLALTVERIGELHWINNKGARSSVSFREGWLPVSEANKLPLPDTSWMRTPWKRSKFTGWITQK
ncbi:MAG: ribonuclease H-like domain-containing protein [Anaerolineales bacterium]|nr:ribonuclease H-like domain-containing protein [Anaerolineales bacterium]